MTTLVVYEIVIAPEVAAVECLCLARWTVDFIEGDGFRTVACPAFLREGVINTGIVVDCRTDSFVVASANGVVFCSSGKKFASGKVSSDSFS